ncbi:MAG: dTDP-4-dehydrorhamnose 3,5-epimerase [Myxococcota bacterium]
MIFRSTPLQGAFVVELEPHRDDRGGFARTFCEREFADHGLATRYPQANVSWNHARHTLRGLHWQAFPYGEDKLVRCTAGAIHDVIVDLRRESPTRLAWFGVELSAANRRALYVPRGFAHGFLTLEDDCEVSYAMSESFAPEAGRGLRFDDPKLGIRWPAPPAVISERDLAWPAYDDALLCEVAP